MTRNKLLKLMKNVYEDWFVEEQVQNQSIISFYQN